MLNKIILMGRLTRDPELRQTQSGTKVASFSLAVDRDFVVLACKRETDFIDCVAWRGTGESAAEYFTKGQMAAEVAVERDWISVEDRLPEVWRNDETAELVNYMIYSPDFGVDIGNYHATAKKWLCTGLPCTVTHWMPLPEPPEEGK